MLLSRSIEAFLPVVEDKLPLWMVVSQHYDADRGIGAQMRAAESDETLQ